MSISIKALVTTLVLGSSSAVFARPVSNQVDRRAEIARADRGEAVRYDQKRNDGERARYDRTRFEHERAVRERGHGRHIDIGPRGRDCR